jgi:hypothetical protein
MQNTDCAEALSNNSLVRIVSENLGIEHNVNRYTFDIHQMGCDYYVTVYLNGGPPDSQIFLVVGRDSKVKERIFGG